MQRRARFSVKRPMAAEMTLQITSMADIFTIILVFLLKSFAGGNMTVTPDPSTQLPQAASGSETTNALTIEINEKGVLVDNEPVTELTAFRFPASELLPNGLSKSLDVSFDRQRKRRELISKSNPDVKADGRLLVMADKRVPYLTLKSIISAAAVHGYSDLKLVVVKKE